jgi:hypothetical protein
MAGNIDFSSAFDIHQDGLVQREVLGDGRGPGVGYGHGGQSFHEEY